MSGLMVRLALSLFEIQRLHFCPFYLYNFIDFIKVALGAGYHLKNIRETGKTKP